MNKELHVKLFRCQHGHWCSVEGCTGSQPLVWVPTEWEVRMESLPKLPAGRAVDFQPVRQLSQHIRKIWPSNFR